MSCEDTPVSIGGSRVGRAPSDICGSIPRAKPSPEGIGTTFPATAPGHIGGHVRVAPNASAVGELANVSAAYPQSPAVEPQRAAALGVSSTAHTPSSDTAERLQGTPPREALMDVTGENAPRAVSPQMYDARRARER